MIKRQTNETLRSDIFDIMLTNPPFGGAKGGTSSRTSR